MKKCCESNIPLNFYIDSCEENTSQKIVEKWNQFPQASFSNRSVRLMYKGNLKHMLSLYIICELQFDILQKGFVRVVERIMYEIFSVNNWREVFSWKLLIEKEVYRKKLLGTKVISLYNVHCVHHNEFYSGLKTLLFIKLLCYLFFRLRTRDFGRTMMTVDKSELFSDNLIIWIVSNNLDLYKCCQLANKKIYTKIYKHVHFNIEGKNLILRGGCNFFQWDVGSTNPEFGRGFYDLHMSTLWNKLFYPRIGNFVVQSRNTSIFVFRLWFFAIYFLQVTSAIWP